MRLTVIKKHTLGFSRTPQITVFSVFLNRVSSFHEAPSWIFLGEKQEETAAQGEKLSDNLKPPAAPLYEKVKV